MNKNKLSRFLLSTSVGIITTLGISEVKALTPAELAAVNATISQQHSEIRAHRTAMVAHLKSTNSAISDGEALKLADQLILTPSGLFALNTVGSENSKQLFDHFQKVLTGGIALTEKHFDDFLSQIADINTLKELGVSDVRQLKLPEAERVVLPAQITKVEDAVYFANQRKDAGEFAKAADFFKKARELELAASNLTAAAEYGEKALLMYSEHFVHHVARVSSVTAENVSAAQALLLEVVKLAQETNTSTAFVRAASCAEELGTAIHDLVVVKKAKKAEDLAKAAAADQAAVTTAANATIVKLYKDLYNADIVSRDMRVKAADKSTGSAKNTQVIAAANAMRLAIGALADAQSVDATAKFEGDVTVKVKLKDEAVAFNDLYTDHLSGTADSDAEKLVKFAADAQILNAKLKATWNARAAFATGDAEYTALDTQYNQISTAITSILNSANAIYAALVVSTGAEAEKWVRDIATVRLVRAEALHRLVSEKAAVAGLPHGDLTTAVDNLSTYVGTHIATLTDTLDSNLKDTLKDKRIAAIRSARTDVHKTIAAARALVARGIATQLEKIAQADAPIADRATRLEAYLTAARQADNKAAWEAGVTAVDAVLAHADVAAPADDNARLVKALALTAKAEALLKRNTAAADTSVAAVDAATGVLDAGLLFDAEALATAIDNANRAHRIRAYKELRQAFAAAVELHNSAAVKQGLRTAWAALENAYAADEIVVADTTLNVSLLNGNAGFMSAALAAFTANANLADVKAALAAASAAPETTIAAGGAGTVINNANYLHITLNGVRYVTKAVADVTVGPVTTFDFEAAVAGGPAAGATAFSITLGAGVADLNALKVSLDAAFAAARANTLAAHYAAMAADPAAVAAGETVTLDSLDTVEKLYNHLVSTYAKIRSEGTHKAAYAGFESAAKAWEKARQAKVEWAKHEVDNLSSATAATFPAKRTAAAQAYTDAAGFETARLRALFAQGGRGLFTDAAFDSLDEVVTVMAADNGRLAAFYVNEDVLTSLHRRAVNLKASAEAYRKSRPLSGDDALIVADAVNADAQVALAVRGANVGAFEVATNLVNAAFRGLTNYNAAADFGALVAERLAVVSAAYSKVNAAWLPDLKSTLTLTSDSATANAHRAALQALLQDGDAVDAGVDLAGRIYSLGQLFAPAANYAQTQAVRRDVALGYETVLRTLESLSVTGATLDAHQGHVASAIMTEAKLAEGLAFTVVDSDAVLATRLAEALESLEQRAARAEAAKSAAYGATRTNTPSDTETTARKQARGLAIDAALSLISIGEQDVANIILNEGDTAVATASLKAKAAHALARVLVAKGGAEAIRFNHSNNSAHKATSLDAFQKGLAAYRDEIARIVAETTEGQMPNRNTRLLAAYEGIAAACAEMIRTNVTTATTQKELYTAIFNQAEILYREGHKTRALALLESLRDNSAAQAVHGSILNELAAQYEAEGKFLKAAQAFELSAVGHVAAKDAKAAFASAEAALAAAGQAGHQESAKAAAGAFNAIGESNFHGRVRAEAYHKAADAYILGGLYADAATAYANSAARWAAIGDHMNAGNQFEKAAWAISKVASITPAQRVALVQYVEKAAHQLQIADATQRLEKLVTLAEEQITAILADDSAADLKNGVIAIAGALYEKALAFQKEGDLTHAQAAEKRMGDLLVRIGTDVRKAAVLAHRAGLYMLQKDYAKAINDYLQAAADYVEGKNLLEAAKMYAKAADAGLAGGQGNRIKDEILPALLEITANVLPEGEHHAAVTNHFEIHLAVLEVYQDLVASHPGEVTNALAALDAVEKLDINDKLIAAQIAAIKVALLAQKARATSSATQKAADLASAQAAFDKAKAYVGASELDKTKVQKFVALAANRLAEMYMHSKAIHSADGLAQLQAFKAVVDAAEAAAKASFTSASLITDGYDAALEASKYASQAMAVYTRAMLHYVKTEGDKARADDIVALRAIPARMVGIAENAVRSTLLGILKSREEAKAIQGNFVAVMNEVNKVNTYVAAVRAHPAVRDTHGNVAVVATLKSKATAAPTAMKNAVADLKASAAAAHATLDPVARATATDTLVVDKTDAIATAVVGGLQAHADLTTQAPAAEVSKEALADTAAAITAVVVGDGKTKGLVSDLHHAQTGPSTATQAVVEKR